MAIPREVYEQLTAVYRRMGWDYRPMAPSDGFGHVIAPREQLDLEAEADRFAREWWNEEHTGTFWIGNCHFPFRPATVCAVAAAQLMCGGCELKEAALKMLRMAIDELEKA